MNRVPENGEKEALRQVREKYDRLSRRYHWCERHLVLLGVKRWRRELWRRVRSPVLELGVGSGANFPYYPEGAEVTGVDISPGMLQKAQEALDRGETRARVELLEGDIQDLPFADDAFATVVATFVFCTVPDPFRGLAEAARVCRPDGEILLLEHQRSGGRVLGPLLDRLDPWAVRVGGEHVNRPTRDNIRAAGLELAREQWLFSDVFRFFVVHPGSSRPEPGTAAGETAPGAQ